MVWHDIRETEVSKLNSSKPLFVLSENKLISMKAQKVNKIKNSSKLIQISSVSGYSIKVTLNHKMLIKRKNQKIMLQAKNIDKNDKIATIGKLNITDIRIPYLKNFIFLLLQTLHHQNQRQYRFLLYFINVGMPGWSNGAR